MKQRKDGRWCKKITLSDGSAKYFYSLARTEKSALQDFNRQILEYETTIINRNAFDAVAERWADETFNKIENNSLKVYKPAYRECVQFFKNKPVERITPTDIKAFISTYEKRGLSPKTMKNKLLVINLIMKHAIIEQHISSNPCQYITIKSTKKKEKRRALSAADVEKVKNSVNCTFGFFALFLLYTGLRRGEAFALTPNDIDYENQTVSINKTVEWLGNVPQIKPCPKTEAGNRVVPLPNILMKELEKRKNNNYIFENEKGEIIGNSQVTRKWSAYKKESEVDATPHMLRHTYATMLFDAEIDVKTAQTWLGHTDIKTTLDIYTHLSEERRESSTEKWRKYVIGCQNSV